MSRPEDDVLIDLGSPLLNKIADAFLTTAMIGATKVAAEDTYYSIKGGRYPSYGPDNTLKHMCTNGAYYGTVAGVYVMTETGLETMRGKRDWKNSLVAGALTGALASAVNKNKKEKILEHAVTFSAIVTAAEIFKRYMNSSPDM